MLKPILLVEDNPFDQELALAALGRARLANETVVVGDGVEALDYLRREGKFAEREAGNPAVILLDLKLPKIDGLEVLKAVRADAATARVPVVMLTGSREHGDLEACYASGANAYVVKPIEFSDLVRVVGEIGTFWAVLNEPPPGSLRYIQQ
ncbi:response regulator [Massilia sp. SYSU DXS3249]